MISESIYPMIETFKEYLKAIKRDIEGTIVDGEDREYARRLKHELEPINREKYLRRFEFTPCSRLVRMMLESDPDKGCIGRNFMLMH